MTSRFQIFAGAATTDPASQRRVPSGSLSPEPEQVRTAFSAVRETAATKVQDGKLADVFRARLEPGRLDEQTLGVVCQCLEDPDNGLTVAREEHLARTNRHELLISLAEVDLLRGGFVGMVTGRMSRLVRLIANSDSVIADQAVGRLMQPTFTHPQIQHLLGQHIAARMVRGRDPRAEQLAEQIVSERRQDEVGATFAGWLIHHVGTSGIRCEKAIELVTRTLDSSQPHPIRSGLVSRLGDVANDSKIATDLLLSVVDERRHGTPLREQALRILCDLRPEHMLAWNRVEKLAVATDDSLQALASRLLRTRDMH